MTCQQEKMRVRDLERELRRKEKAHAEAAALLVLKKPRRSGGEDPPCVVLHQEAECVGLVETGAARLVGAEGECIHDAILLDPPKVGGEASVFYGKGDSGWRIAKTFIDCRRFK